MFRVTVCSTVISEFLPSSCLSCAGRGGENRHGQLGGYQMGEFHSQIVLTIYKLIEQNVIRFTAQHKISSGSKKSVVQIVRENLSLGDLRPSDIATLSENQILEVITTLERDQAAKEKSRRGKSYK